MTRAKFELAATSNKTVTDESETIEIKQTEEIVHEVVEKIVEKAETIEKTKKKIKQPVKKTIAKKTAKVETTQSTQSTEIAKVIPAKLIIEIPANNNEIEQRITSNEETSSTTISSSNVHVHRETFVHEEEDMEIHEEIEQIHIKVYKEILSEIDIDTFKLGDEVNEILETIEAEKFGTGELSLRELATIGCLLRKGMTVTEIIQLYHSNVFPALRIPESQAAMVQLVERQGFESLISEVITEESTEDEQLFGSTVGFRAFMKMIEMNNVSVEDIIAKFRCEDFYTHEWKQNEMKEEIIETSEGVFTTTEQRFTSGNVQ